MFNRANKMTALLVAAAAVVSLVPATGVNAAEVKRVGSEDGKIHHAVAYKDGKAYLDGEANEKDEAGYYFSGGKYTELEKIDTDSNTELYGEKYVNVADGEYYVDLATGKVTDDDLKEENRDDAKSALKKKIKDKAEQRYSNHNVEPDTIEELAGNKYGEVWYATTYASDDATNGGNANRPLNVYTDAKGNYIDADYNLGKVKVDIEKIKSDSTTANTVTITDTSVNIENTDSTKKVGTVNDDKDNKKVELSASVEKAHVIGQDNKNIYRLVEVTIKLENANGGARIAKINGKAVVAADDSNYAVKRNGDNVTFKAIQKISKDQSSDTIDGAKYAKTVNTYMLSNNDGKVEKKVKDFVELVYDATENIDADFTIVNGKVIAYKLVGGEVVVQVTSLKSNYIDPEKQADSESVEHNADADTDAIQVDVDGNLWRLDGGFIYKFDNEDGWDKVYRVDGSMDQLSVYNKDNMVTWSEDDKVYSVIGAKEDKEEDKKPEVTVKTGWNQAADGTWTFVNADNTKATGWLQDGANWYLLNEAGIMQTGWQTVGGTWYYLAGNGAMQTGWQNINGAWYFLQGSGAMQTGWINDNGTWYFADGSGKMLANTTVNGYVLGANGAWVK